MSVVPTQCRLKSEGLVASRTGRGRRDHGNGVTQVHQTLNTYYDGFGGGGVGTLVVDLFDTNTQQLVWRESSSGTLSNKSDKTLKLSTKAWTRCSVTFLQVRRNSDIAMLGILVHGDNHFIAHGPLPDKEVAIALVRHWSLIQIGAPTPPPLDGWIIVSKAFRENLEWAVVVPGADEMSPAVAQLLAELSARGVVIHDSRYGAW